VPIIGRNQRLGQSAIRIDYGRIGRKTHLRGIQSANGKAPFLTILFHYFEAVYQKKT